MKRGVVVHIRVNPEDIMGCLDVVDAARIYVEGMSAAQVVRIALSGLLEAARTRGMIQRRSGFEYADMMRRLDGTNHGRKVAITEAFDQTKVMREVEDREGTGIKLPDRLTDDAPELSDDLMRKKGRLLVQCTELQFKKNADPDNWTVGEQAQLDSLQSELDVLSHI